MRTEDLHLAHRQDGLRAGYHQRDVSAGSVLGGTVHQDGVTFLLGTGQPVTQRIVLVGGRVSNTNFHILDGQIITATSCYTNMFHSLELNKTSVLVTLIS